MAEGRFTGRVSIVTGAGSGIGQATAIACAREGARVAVIDINIRAAESVADEIESLGGDAIAIQCDVSVPGEVDGGFAAG